MTAPGDWCSSAGASIHSATVAIALYTSVSFDTVRTTWPFGRRSRATA